MGNKDFDATLYPGVSSMDIGDDQIGVGGWSQDLPVNKYHHDGFLMRLDYRGSLYDYRLYPDREDQLIYKTMRTKDKSFAMGGYSNTLNPGLPDVWLLESYDVIKEKCRMESPDRPQQKFDVDIIKSIVKDIDIKTGELGVKDYDFPYEEVALCKRERIEGFKSTARLATNSAGQPEGQLLGGRSWRIKSGIPGDVQVNVLNSVGQRVLTASGLSAADRVDLGQLAAGIYLIRMQDKSGISTSKIILQ